MSEWVGVRAHIISSSSIASETDFYILHYKLNVRIIDERGLRSKLYPIHTRDAVIHIYIYITHVNITYYVYIFLCIMENKASNVTIEEEQKHFRIWFCKRIKSKPKMINRRNKLSH